MRRERKAKFEAGEFVFHKGDQGKSFFIVESGSFVILDDATELATLRKGGCFGELALIKSDTRAASVQALESATCLTRTGRTSRSSWAASRRSRTCGAMRPCARSPSCPR